MDKIWKKIRSLVDSDGEAEPDKEVVVHDEGGKNRELKDKNSTLEDVCLCISVGDRDKAPCFISLLEFSNGAAGTRADNGRPPNANTKPPKIYLGFMVSETKSTKSERAKLLPMERYAKQHKWYLQLIGLIADAGPFLATHVDKCYDGDLDKFVAELDDLAVDVGDEKKGTTAIAALHELFAGIAHRWYKRES